MIPNPHDARAEKEVDHGASRPDSSGPDSSGPDSSGPDSFEPVNPYAPTVWVNESSDDAVSEVVRTRRKHIGHETSIIAIGGLLCLIALPFLISLVLVMLEVARRPSSLDAGFGISLFLLAAVASILIALGIGLRRLNPTARIFGIVFGALSLLAFPFGTLLGGYLLSLLLSKKGQTIFSLEYQDVIEQTPEVTHRGSIRSLAIIAGLVLSSLGLLLVGL